MTSILGLTLSFIDVTCSKIPKNAIFRKSAEKVLEKCGGSPILTDYFENYAKMKICTKFSKSKTPLNTPLSTCFFVVYAFFGVLFAY